MAGLVNDDSLTNISYSVFMKPISAITYQDIVCFIFRTRNSRATEKEHENTSRFMHARYMFVKVCLCNIVAVLVFRGVAGIW